jgi:hypothetical protein
MDDRFLCPDCSAEHSEPLDATLGHVARCLTCAIEHEAFTRSGEPVAEVGFEIAA